jgi:hypothetical protein
MNNEIDKELSSRYCPRFGQLAVEKGYVTQDQIKEALSEQVDDDLNDRSHRLIGRILLEKGYMTANQIEVVLNELFKK